MTDPDTNPTPGKSTPIDDPANSDADTPERWCPEHGLHDEWMTTEEGDRCERNHPAQGGLCWLPPIAPEVVAAIEARGAARERAAVVERVKRYIEKNASGDSDEDKRARFLFTSFGLGYQEGWHAHYGDPLAEHDARVREEAHKEVHDYWQAWAEAERRHAGERVAAAREDERERLRGAS